MCGILISHLKFNPSNLNELNKLVDHRGPNGIITTETKNYLFLNSILSISGDRKINEKIFSNERYLILFNGEIYNYLDIAKKYNFKNITKDTEILLPLFLKIGTSMFSILDGMFTICIYDKFNNKLVIGRDFFGVKPLFYYKNMNNEFIFASEIRSIKKLLGFNQITCPIIDKKIIKYYFDRRTNHNNETFFKDIFRLGKGKISKIDLDNGIINESIIDFKNSQLLQNSSEVINKNIDNQIKTNIKKTGLFFSGGYDSSLILDRAIENNLNLELFSSFDENDLSNDESKNIDSLIKSKKLNINVLKYNSFNFLKSTMECTEINQFPLPDSSMITHFNLCKLADKKNIKVILSGSGGDEVFYGYYNHLYAYLSELLKSNPKEFYDRINFFSQNLSFQKINLILKSFFFLMPDNIKNSYHRVKFNNIFDTNLDLQFYEFKNKNNLDNISNHFINNHLTQYLDYEDGNSSNFGIEARPVFANYNLYNQLQNINDKSIFFRNGLKSISKNNFLHLDIKHHNKFHFYSPWEKYLSSNTVTEYIYDNLFKVKNLDIPKVIALLENFVKKKHRKFDDIFRLFSIIIFYDSCS